MAALIHGRDLEPGKWPARHHHDDAPEVGR
jgi:hypothetical protein